MSEKQPIKEPANYDETIQDFIQKIDSEKSLFILRDELHGLGIIFLDIALFILLTLAVWFTPDFSFVQKITLIIAIVAIMTTFTSVFREGLKERVVEANFEKAFKKFQIEEKKEEKRLLLKALIKIKAENPKFKLETVKKMHSEIFTKKSLLEKLYDSSQ
jgi:uncharacterized membrane protein